MTGTDKYIVGAGHYWTRSLALSRVALLLGEGAGVLRVVRVRGVLVSASGQKSTKASQDQSWYCPAGLGFALTLEK